LNFIITEVIPRFIVYELVNISMRLDFDNSLAPKKN